MITRYFTIILCISLLVIGTGGAASGNQPLDDIRSPIDEIIDILRDPQYRDDANKAEQRQKIWNIVDRIFDFTEIARRTLARNWKVFSPDEKKEFIAVFSEFLTRIYLDRIQGEYSNERVEFVDHKIIAETKASVKTKVIRAGNIEIPVDYRLIKKNDTWKVYDVIIEGVSLVKNYRTQFRGILLKEKPSQLIDTLKKKIEKSKGRTSSANTNCLDLGLVSKICLSSVWIDSPQLRYHIR